MYIGSEQLNKRVANGRARFLTVGAEIFRSAKGRTCSDPHGKELELETSMSAHVKHDCTHTHKVLLLC